ncbi:MAG: hypothetical protein IJB79_03110 [Candidatus Gastranaerophilales bacterium]|nr:hypothetical protein [Candidatus Gastranaerophilales bacterium]
MKLNIQNVSFSALIPKEKTALQNKKTGEFEPAIFCEVDCKDKNDYQIFTPLKESWEYGLCLELTSNWKYGNYANKIPDPRGHYILQKESGEILAICRTTEADGTIRIDYLESKPQTVYRFAGQMMLSRIAKEGIKKGYKKLTIPYPVEGTERFYKNACGFKEQNDGYIMENEELIDFVANSPRKIN